MRRLVALVLMCAAIWNYSFDVKVIIHSAGYKWLQVVLMFWLHSDYSSQCIRSTAENNCAVERISGMTFMKLFIKHSFQSLAEGRAEIDSCTEYWSFNRGISKLNQTFLGSGYIDLILCMGLVWTSSFQGNDRVYACQCACMWKQPFGSPKRICDAQAASIA